MGLHPGQPGMDGRDAVIQGLVAQPDQAQLGVGPTVAAPGQVRQGGLERGEHPSQLGGGKALGQAPQRGVVKAAGEERSACRGRGLSNEQIPGQRGQLS